MKYIVFVLGATLYCIGCELLECGPFDIGTLSLYASGIAVTTYLDWDRA